MSQNCNFETSTFIHDTAQIEDFVEIGPHCYIWDHVHIRENTTLGHHVSVGEKTHIAYNVKIGNFVKINALVYICTKVTIHDQCMISAGTVFTNDLFPRAMNRSLTDLETSEPTKDTLETIVHQGVTIGANATIGPGIEIGKYAMVGMGSVVTKNVPDFGLVMGNPAKLTGFVCFCGPKIIDLKNPPLINTSLHCNHCQRNFVWQNQGLKSL